MNPAAMWEGLQERWQAHQAHSSQRKRVMSRRCAPMVVVPPRAGRLPSSSSPLAVRADVCCVAIIPGDSVGEAVITMGLINFLNLYNSALIVRLVLTWFPNPPEFIAQPLATVTDPYLNLFRGIIPPLGGTLDLSPILAFVTLNFFQSTATALPCELGPDGQPVAEQRPQRKQQQGNPFQFLQPTRLQAAWQQRVNAQRAAKDSTVV